MIISLYRYKALDTKGKHIRGYIEAPNEHTAFNILRERSIYPFKIKKTKIGLVRLIRNPIGKLPLRHILIFCQQMYIMLDSGIPLLQTLQSIYENTKYKYMKLIIKDVYIDLQRGISLSKSFEKHKSRLPHMFIEMVYAGETSGNLELSFKYLAEYYEREYMLKKKTINILLYPICVLILTISVVHFLVSYVTPHFMDIYTQSAEELPKATKILLNINRIMGRGRTTLVLAIVLIVIFIISSKVQYQFHAFILNLPIIGEMLVKTITTRICTIMSMLLKSGISVIDSLEMSHDVIRNKKVKSELKIVQKKIDKGEDILQSFSSSKFFPLVFIQLLSAGVISGSMEQAFDGVAKFYEAELERDMERYIGLMEPILLIIVGIIVGFISYALVLPIYRLIEIL